MYSGPSNGDYETDSGIATYGDSGVSDTHASSDTGAGSPTSASTFATTLLSPDRLGSVRIVILGWRFWALTPGAAPCGNRRWPPGAAFARPLFIFFIVYPNLTLFLIFDYANTHTPGAGL